MQHLYLRITPISHVETIVSEADVRRALTPFVGDMASTLRAIRRGCAVASTDAFFVFRPAWRPRGPHVRWR